MTVAAGLHLIRVRQRRFGTILWGFAPLVLFAVYLGQQPSASETAFFIGTAAAYGAVLLAYSFRLAFTECPRCNKFYHLNWWADPWTKRCLHCGLPLHTEETT